MNRLSSSSVVLPSRPLAGSVFAGLGASLNSLARTLLSRWRDSLAQRREARALAAVGEMDLHMLRDIGAPEHLIARAAEARSAYGRRDRS